MDPNIRYVFGCGACPLPFNTLDTVTVLVDGNSDQNLCLSKQSCFYCLGFSNPIWEEFWFRSLSGDLTIQFQTWDEKQKSYVSHLPTPSGPVPTSSMWSAFPRFPHLIAGGIPAFLTQISNCSLLHDPTLAISHTQNPFSPPFIPSILFISPHQPSIPSKSPPSGLIVFRPQVICVATIRPILLNFAFIHAQGPLGSQWDWVQHIWPRLHFPPRVGPEVDRNRCPGPVGPTQAIRVHHYATTPVPSRL